MTFKNFSNISKIKYELLSLVLQRYKGTKGTKIQTVIRLSGNEGSWLVS